MFDPYRKWLGIQPKDQPPNHYRLLGVDAFEDDLDVIEGAADRQMSFVRQYQSGEHAAAAAKILNELAVARLCLLKPATKTAYDEKLRKQLAPPEPEPNFPTEPLSFSGEVLPFERATKRKKSSQSKNPVSPQLMIGCGAAAVVCLLLVMVLSRSSQRPAPKPVDTPATPVISSKVEAAPKLDAAPASPTSTKEPAPSVVWTESQLMTEPAGPPVDLLRLIDLKRDVASGKWEQTNTALIGDPESRIYLPSKPPDDYQMKLTVRQLGAPDTLMLGFVMAGRQGMLAIDGWNGSVSGLFLDGQEPPSNCTTLRGRSLTAEMATIVLTIHPGHLHAAVNEQTIVDWHGNPERLLLFPGYQMPNRETPTIALAACKYVIESASLIPVKPEPTQPRLARLDHEVDILPLLDSDRDAVRGFWAVTRDSVSSPGSQGQLSLPIVVPEEYTLSATVEVPAEHNGDYQLFMGLIAGTSYCQLIMTEFGTGLDLIDGRRWDLNESFNRGARFKPGTPVRVDCTVTWQGIRIEIGGKTIVNWKGDFSRLSIPFDWSLADSRRPFLASMVHLKIRDLKLGPPLPAPRLPTSAAATVGKPVNLLPLIDPVQDALQGTWERDGTALRCRGNAESNKLVIPFDPPEEYKLSMTVARAAGGMFNNECLAVAVPFGSVVAEVCIDSNKSEFSTVYVDDVATGPHGPLIPADIECDVEIVVRKNGLQLICNGQKVIDWTGNPQRHSCRRWFSVPGQRLALGSYHQGWLIKKLDLEALPESRSPAVPSLGLDGRLLPIIDPDRDGRRGDWKRYGDALVSPAIEGSRILIPATVPKQYVISGTVERQQGDSELLLGLVVAGHPCSVAIDARNGHEAGIDRLDGHRFFNPVNLTHRTYPEPLLPLNQRVPVRCVVLPDAVVVYIADKEIIRWHGDPRRFSALPEFIPPNYSTDDSTHLCLGAWNSTFAFRDWVLNPLSDAEAKQWAEPKQ